MQNLTFPPFDYQIRKHDGTMMIFDIIRKKYVVLTPEEFDSLSGGGKALSPGVDFCGEGD